VIDRDEALRRIAPNTLNQLLHRQVSEDAERAMSDPRDRRGPGRRHRPDRVHRRRGAGLFRAGGALYPRAAETSPEDIRGMHAAEGILTERGGMTSHAAVIARGLGVPCVTGAPRGCSSTCGRRP
jgi:pyruvate,orthophosphate dikinase